jgi:hypothetical protein
MSFLIRNNGNKLSNLGIKSWNTYKEQEKIGQKVAATNKQRYWLKPKYKMEIEHEESQIQITRTNLVALQDTKTAQASCYEVHTCILIPRILS